ncbi:MAG TPA: hypothetical protein VMC02_07415, partial [Steroidobacteraceae bacterium]|nr:hypothetical protein [Steroidobacteraceae bacterium]
MKHFHCRPALLVAGLVLAGTAAAAAAADCDRSCLIGVTDAYLAAMVAHDPAKAPLAPQVRFTENTTPRPVGQGSAWEGATGVRDYRIYVADPAAGQIALYTVIDGKERPALLTLRLKVEHGLITEVESVYVGVGLRGFANVDHLIAAAPVWTEVLPPAKRRTRRQLIAIVQRYFDTLEKQYKDHIPFTDDCLRVENGVVTAGNPQAQGIGALGCRENLNQNIWSYISSVSPRRYTTVDVERGLVSGMFMFHHGGTKTTYVNDKGETVPFGEAMLKKQSVIISELFKVEDGRIRRIEAVMTGG